MKKIIIIIITIIALLAAIGIGFGLKLAKSVKNINAEYENISLTNLSTIPDGTYKGSFGLIPVSVELDVVVKSSKIETVTITKQTSGKGYEAKETTQRIIQAQTSKVDAVSGATMSSKCIMVAVDKALKDAVKNQ